MIGSMKNLMERDIAAGIEDGVKLPSLEMARTFAVETIDYPNPLGLQYVMDWRFPSFLLTNFKPTHKIP